MRDRGQFGAWLAAVAAMLVAAAPLRGQFSMPVCLTEASELVTQAATGIDLANNAYLASVIQERIQVKVFGPGVDAEVPIQAAGLGQGDPDFATDVRGTTYLVFSQLDDPTGALGREVYLANNNGGQGFGLPGRITENRVDDASPRIALDESGDPHLVWAQRVGGQTRVLYVRTREGVPMGEPELAAVGDYPHLFVDRAGVVHLVYSRGNDLLYNSNSGGRFNNERGVTTTPFDPETSASIGGDAEGNLIIAYESRNALYYATRSGGVSFRPPRLIDTGGILTPRMRVTGRGQVTLVYAKQGDIFYALGLPTQIGQPQRVTTTPEVESHPSLELDLSNNIHVSFIAEGRLCYVNNAATPVAEFSAEPARGEVPLEVRFVDLSSGGIQAWRWDFGDGEGSTAQHPTHSYQEPGKYTVTLTVESPGGLSATKAKLDYITVQDPFNTLEIPGQLVIPGQTDVWFPVIAGHKEPVGAFQLMGTYDPNLLRLNRFELAHTLVQPLQPEQLCLNDKGTYFEVCCIFDFFPPFDPARQFLRAGSGQSIMNLVFDVASNAPQGARTEIDLVNDTSISPVFNIFTIDNFTRLPVLRGGQVEVLIGPPFPRFFLRGDVDGDGAIDITDAIRILNFLFVGGAAPLCVDAADVTDSGRVDISQAISLLNYLFLGGPGPSVPFPSVGPDPTPDALPSC